MMRFSTICCGENHEVVITRRGAISLPYHSKEEIEAEEVAWSLDAANACGCMSFKKGLLFMLEGKLFKPSSFRGKALYPPYAEFACHLKTHRRGRVNASLARFPIEEACHDPIYDACQRCGFGLEHVYPSGLRVRWTWKATAGKIGDRGVVEFQGRKALVLDAEYESGWLITLCGFPQQTRLVPVWMRAGKYEIPRGMRLSEYLWIYESAPWAEPEEGALVQYKHGPPKALAAISDPRMFRMEPIRRTILQERTRDDIGTIAHTPVLREFIYRGVRVVEIPLYHERCPICGNSLASDWTVYWPCMHVYRTEQSLQCGNTSGCNWVGYAWDVFLRARKKEKEWRKHEREWYT